LPESLNDNDEMIDNHRISETFKKVVQESPGQIVQHLFEMGERWRNGRLQNDDITLIVIKA
jgi:serine phosphatase RsbU (regulator of sigma subunit)